MRWRQELGREIEALPPCPLLLPLDLFSKSLSYQEDP